MNYSFTVAQLLHDGRRLSKYILRSQIEVLNIHGKWYPNVRASAVMLRSPVDDEPAFVIRIVFYRIQSFVSYSILCYPFL